MFTARYGLQLYVLLTGDTELRQLILDEQSARIYANPLCGCVEEAAERARGSRQCRQNTYSDVAAPRSDTGVGVIVTGALRLAVQSAWRGDGRL